MSRFVTTSCGIVCEMSEGQICINQRPYIDNLVRRFGLSEACGVSTPADACVKLVADDGVSRPADPKLYQQIVGSLQYAAGGTRPDIAYAVSTIAKFCHQPTELHMTAAKRVLRYLKQTRDPNLTYVKDSPKAFIGYSDADWAGDVLPQETCSYWEEELSRGPAENRARWLCRPSKPSTWL